VYVSRVSETARWFKLHEAGRYKLSAEYERPAKIRERGTKVVQQMTIAECMWWLGNYAKHNAEQQDFNTDTKAALRTL